MTSTLRTGETRLPNPGIEADLDAAMNGELDMKSFLVRFADAAIIVPSVVDVASDAARFRPLLFEPDGESLMAVFTSRDRADRWAEAAPYSTVMLGRRIFEDLPDGVGILVNPGFGLGFQLAAAGIPAIAADLDALRVPGIPDPSVVLEQAILDAQTGRTSPETLLETLARSQVYVLSHTDDGLSPVTFLRDGEPGIVGVFTRPDHADQFTEGVEFALYVEAAWLAANLVDGVGIVVNPGTPHPWEISPEVVAAIAR
ncbi:hypothetical protein HD599_003156 [Conyzicola lurida]|uniref:SseB protein N-terminal domain-containing protein n=1 Tax=Conyzicola lurida TaxID=1172621 RepID=A0A841AT61_9MICO|nr:SseB family protein [Conyzicola lurida]MBB5844833.1 hypothetical protein [Conyzicola lurida]